MVAVVLLDFRHSQASLEPGALWRTSGATVLNAWWPRAFPQHLNPSGASTSGAGTGGGASTTTKCGHGNTTQIFNLLALK